MNRRGWIGSSLLMLTVIGIGSGWRCGNVAASGSSRCVDYQPEPMEVVTPGQWPGP